MKPQDNTQDLELERWIHENILKECWCEVEFDSVLNSDVCKKCGIQVAYMWGGSRETLNKHKYSTSLDAVTKVEAAVIAWKGRIHLRCCLFKVIFKDMSTGGGSPTDKLTIEEMTFATASQRARACKLAWEQDSLDTRENRATEPARSK